MDAFIPIFSTLLVFGVWCFWSAYRKRRQIAIRAAKLPLDARRDFWRWEMEALSAASRGQRLEAKKHRLRAFFVEQNRIPLPSDDNWHVWNIADWTDEEVDEALSEFNHPPEPAPETPQSPTP